MAKGIHKGDNTHHQDQDIILVSFSAINRIVNNPQNPIPPDVSLFFILNMYY